MEEIVKEKIEQAIEAVQLDEKAVEVTDKVLDSAEKSVEDTADKVLNKVEEELNVLQRQITGYIGDNQHVLRALEKAEDIILDNVSGREVNCGCFGFLFALKISRRPLAKSVAPLNATEIPPPLQKEEVVLNQSNPLHA